MDDFYSTHLCCWSIWSLLDWSRFRLLPPKRRCRCSDGNPRQSIDHLVRLSTTPKKSLNTHSCSTYDENCSQCLNGAVSYLKDQEEKCSRRLGRTENRDFRRHSPSPGSNFGSECSRSHSGVVRYRRKNLQRVARRLLMLQRRQNLTVSVRKGQTLRPNERRRNAIRRQEYWSFLLIISNNKHTTSLPNRCPNFRCYKTGLKGRWSCY